MKKKLTLIAFALIATMSLWAQDIIVTKDAQKIEAKILEVSTTEIRYKEFDYQDGPTFILSTDEIATITYGNGKVVVYNQSKSAEELARERAQRGERARQQAEIEQKDMDELGRVREEEERARRQAEAEAVAKANNISSLFRQSENTSGAGLRGNPVGHGSGGGTSWSLMGRGIKGTLPMPSNNFKQEGKVVVQIRVNTAGDVVEAKHVGGNVNDRQTIQLALDAAKKAKFTEGDAETIGTITYIFKLN